MSDTGETKSKQATTHKLKKQREKGSYPKSAFLTEAAAFTASIIAAMILSNYIFIEIEGVFRNITYYFDAEFVDKKIHIDFFVRIYYLLYYLIIFSVLVFIFSSIIYSGGIVIAFDAVMPKFDNLSPNKYIKKTFSIRNLAESLSEIFRLLLWIIIAIIITYYYHEQVLSSLACGKQCIISNFYQLFLNLIIAAIILLITFSIIDAVLQRNLFSHEQMMTESEHKRDRKETSGSPEMRAEIRRIRNETSGGSAHTEHRGLSEDVYLFTDFKVAIAIRLSFQDEHFVPVMVAMGRDDGCERLLKEGLSRKIPVIEDAEVTKDVARIFKSGNYVPEQYIPKVVDGIAPYIDRSQLENL